MKGRDVLMGRHWGALRMGVIHVTKPSGLANWSLTREETNFYLYDQNWWCKLKQGPHQSEAFIFPLRNWD